MTTWTIPELGNDDLADLVRYCVDGGTPADLDLMLELCTELMVRTSDPDQRRQGRVRRDGDSLQLQLATSLATVVYDGPPEADVPAR